MQTHTHARIDIEINCGAVSTLDTVLQQRRQYPKKRQAEKMLRNSEKRFQPMDVGSTVMIPLPDVDRGRAEFPNVKAVVMEVNLSFVLVICKKIDKSKVNENGQHKLGTIHGVLMQRYAANQFTPCTEKFLGIENVLTGKESSLREAARQSSMGDGQGFFKCGCTKSCKKGSCKCFKNNKKCNSKCHSSNPCDNKNE
jgi:hypothetical protein